MAKSQNILFGGAQVGTSKLSNLKPINRYGISWLGYALKQNLMRRESLNKLNGYKNRYERLESCFRKCLTLPLMSSGMSIKRGSAEACKVSCSKKQNFFYKNI